MATNMPPPPYNVPFTGQSGVMSIAWQGWFRQLFVRIGGLVAPANSDIEAVQDTTNTQGSSISSLSNQINNLKDDLGQGRAL